MKDEELISDGGKIKKTHLGDVIVITVCIAVSVVLLLLGAGVYM